MSIRISLEDNSRTYRWRKREKDSYCSFCPYHDIENRRGSHSKYGKKKAAKSFYVNGKGRKKPKKYDGCTLYQHYGTYSYKVLSV